METRETLETSATVTTALIPYVGGDATDRMTAWTDLPRDERRRKAVAACISHDAATLHDLALAYLALTDRGQTGVNTHTRRAYHQAIDALLATWDTGSLLHRSGDDGRAWVQGLKKAGARDRKGHPQRTPDGHPVGLTPASLQVYLAAARALYAALRWAGATTADPWRDVKAPKDPTAASDKRAPYEEGEIARLLAHAAGEDRALVLLGAHAGLRVAEALALTWADVDLTAARLTVVAGKGNKGRRVEMSPTLVSALRALTATGDRAGGGGGAHVLPYRAPISARRRLALLCARAGVAYKGVHALRHSAGTAMYRATGRLEDAQHHLGHATIATTQVYAHWSDERVKTAVQGW